MPDRIWSMAKQLCDTQIEEYARLFMPIFLHKEKIGGHLPGSAKGAQPVAGGINADMLWETPFDPSERRVSS
jgi:hypothetical protein